MPSPHAQRGSVWKTGRQHVARSTRGLQSKGLSPRPTAISRPCAPRRSRPESAVRTPVLRAAFEPWVLEPGLVPRARQRRHWARSAPTAIQPVRPPSAGLPGRGRASVRHRPRPLQAVRRGQLRRLAGPLPAAPLQPVRGQGARTLARLVQATPATRLARFVQGTYFAHRLWPPSLLRPS